EVVATHFKLNIEDLNSSKRTKNLAVPRQIAMYLCRELTDTSLPQIGEFFGGRDHTTVLHAYNKIARDRASNIQLDKTVQELIKSIEKM
ncbi:MAG: helix-turn-helix domain-containing protein, partial [Anaerovibrio sp.]|nr:helix-turn-helix domain-containing protein [Anaerovibrio sp.]